MKLLITGGRGYIGSWLTKIFSEKNIPVTVTSSSRISGDLYLDLKKPSTFNVIQDDFDYIIHTASLNYNKSPNYPEEALDVNTLGTRRLLEHISGFKKLKGFLYLSTFHVYGRQTGFINEETGVFPKTDYALTHYFAEKYVNALLPGNIHKIILRLSNGYGLPPRIEMDAWKLLLNDLAKQAFEAGEVKLTGNPSVQRDLVWLGDVSECVFRLLNENRAGLYNVSSGKSLSLQDVVSILGLEYEKRFESKLKISLSQTPQIGTLEDLIYSSDKIKEALGITFSNMIGYELNKIWDFLERKDVFNCNTSL